MPTSLEALVVIFIFAVPAYLAVTIYKARNPVHYYRETQSAIEQAALYVFLGSIVNILAIFYGGLLWSISLHIRDLLPNELLLLFNGFTDLVGLGLALFLLVIAYLAASIGFSYLIGDILGQFLRVETPLWVEEIKNLRVRKDGSKPWVLVQLKNGDRCLGFIREARWTGGNEDTMEFLLEKTYYQVTNTAKKENVGRVLIRSGDILWLGHYLD